MIAELISKFHRLAEAMDLAIQSSDTNKVQELDRLLVEAWESIIAWQPTNPNHVPQTIEFLVDQLIASVDTGEYSRSIKDKILELVAYLSK